MGRDPERKVKWQNLTWTLQFWLYATAIHLTSSKQYLSRPMELRIIRRPSWDRSINFQRLWTWERSKPCSIFHPPTFSSINQIFNFHLRAILFYYFWSWCNLLKLWLAPRTHQHLGMMQRLFPKSLAPGVATELNSANSHYVPRHERHLGKNDIVPSKASLLLKKKNLASNSS